MARVCELELWKPQGLIRLLVLKKDTVAVPNNHPENGSFLFHSVNPAQRLHWLEQESSLGAGVAHTLLHPSSTATVVGGLSRKEVRNSGQWQDAQDTDRPAGVLSAARDTKL